MKAAIHYIVKGKFIRCTTADQIDFVKFDELFEDENPILARERAFEYFQNYLDVLLDSDKNVRDRFKSQYTILKELSLPELPPINESSTTEEIKERLKYFNENYNIKSDFRDRIDVFNGIGIYLIMNVPIVPPSVIVDDYEPEDYPIFGLDFNQDVFDPKVMIDGLTSEFQYYEHFKYDTKDYAIQIKYHYSGEPEPEEETILDTPFDWKELFAEQLTEANSQFSGKLTGDPKLPNEQIATSTKPLIASLLDYSSEKIKELLNRGEGKVIEYKSTLLFNPESHKGIKGKGVIAKTICSFLNSCGGYLFIGVNDKSVPIGLISDFKRFNKDNPKDSFKLEFDKMIREFFLRKVNQYVNGDFFEIDGKDIFIVLIEPSDRPVFMNWREDKLFFIRGQASSQLVTDTEEIVQYCLDQKNFLKSN